MSLWFVALSTNLAGSEVCPTDHTTPGGADAGLASTGRTVPSLRDRSMPTQLPSGSAPRECSGVCCCCAAMATLPGRGAALPAVGLVPVDDAAPPAAVAASVATPRFLQPPAIGPPALHNG
jgi:hypothetical protein